MFEYGFAVRVTQGVFLILLSPAICGLLAWGKARLQGRYRPWTYALQSYRDLLKLFRKPGVRPETASRMFSWVPLILLTAYSWLAFSVPVFSSETLVAIDFIVVIYVLGFARFLHSLSGLDTGASLGGVGSNRERFFDYWVEIGLILVMAVLMFHWKTLNLYEILKAHQQLGIKLFTYPDLAILAISLAGLILLDAGHIPYDNPHTHLELTMGHKAVNLEYAGRDLAMVEWAEMIKFTFFVTIFCNLFIPYPLPSSMISNNVVFTNPIMLGIWFGLKVLIFIVLLILWDLHRPKLRIRRVVKPALFCMALSIMALIYSVASPLP